MTREREKFAARSDNLRATAERAYGFVVMFFPVVTVLMGATIVSIMWIGGNDVFAGTMLSGDLLAFFTYASEILMSLMMVSMLMMILTRSIACARRIVEVLDEQPQITDGQADSALTVADGSIRFDHVYFKYHPESEAWNLEDVSVDIASGMTVGIIGGTGSAKSTFVQPDPPPVRGDGGQRERRRAQREGLHRPCPARRLRYGAAEEHALFRHDQRKPPLGRRKRHGRGAARGLPHRLRG